MVLHVLREIGPAEVSVWTWAIADYEVEAWKGLCGLLAFVTLEACPCYSPDVVFSQEVGMRSAAIALALSAPVGCSNEASSRLPTVPSGGYVSEVTPTSAWLWVRVFEEHGSGACIPGATIQVVSETGDVGELITLKPCSWWDYGGGVELKGLTPNVPVKLRASASGFIPREQTLMPCVRGCNFVFIELTAKRTE